MQDLSFLEKLSEIYGKNITIGDLLIKLNEAEYVDIYADGSSSFINNKRQEGIGVYFGDNDSRNISMLIEPQGNNQAEIIACIEGLKVVKNKYHFVSVHTDSRLVVDGMNSKCKKTKYPKLFDELENLSTYFINIRWLHVKGHADNRGNIEADKLSRICYNL